MSVLSLTPDTLAFNVEQSKSAGAKLAHAYQSGHPFPHIVIDDFINADILARLNQEWPDTDQRTFFNRNQERLKYQWARSEISSPFIRSFLAEMNSPGMIAFLEAMTGIKKLIPDPYFSGGGLHETKPGGHLSIHADFNVHGELNLLRRINLLIYLNEDWPQSFGGNLELWTSQMTSCVKTISPDFGRAVVFNTDADSFHGQPEPLNCPPDRARRSVALYYYTAAPEGINNIRRRTTQFKPRPNSHDQTDWTTKINELFEAWSPPILLIHARRALNFIKRKIGTRH